MKYRNYWMMLGMSILLTNTMCDTQKDYSEYQELHQHNGSDNYEIATIFPKEYQVYEILFDTVAQQLNVPGNTNPIDKQETEGGRRKISNIGKVLDEGPICNILKDGSIMYINTYFNWVMDGDKTEHTFKDPLTEEEKKDSKKWMEKFKALYSEASYVYIPISFTDYYFKIDGEWFFVEAYRKAEELEIDIKKQYPPKENQDVRFMELRDLRSGKMEKDTTLARLVGYEETDSEEGVGFNPISFSAGHYFMELYMPLGDTIKIKRHGSMGTNMQFYKIPVTQGGRNDVVFIVQEPNEMYPDREFGGMYVVRPRNLEQKEYGSYKSNADSYMSQYDSIWGNIDVEAKFLKPMDD